MSIDAIKIAKGDEMGEVPEDLEIQENEIKD